MDFTRARKAMIDGQLTPNKIVNKNLLNRFNEVPRESFVDARHKDNAYSDSYLSMSPEREIIPPMVCARMIQALDIQNGDKTLVLAAGSGYSATIISSLAKETHAIEENINLFEMAKRSMMDAKCKCVTFHSGKPELGLADQAPFNKILIDTPVEYIPNNIWEQLSDNGKLCAIQEQSNGICVATVFTKNGKQITTEPLIETGGHALENFKKPQTFTF